MGNLLQDLRYGLRTLRKSPGFAAVAVLTLALAIGANTTLFSIVNGVLLSPLAFPQADQIVTISGHTPQFNESSFSYPNYLDWARMNHTFASTAAYRGNDFNLTGTGDTERLKAMEVSASFFTVLGVKPVLGRTFTPEEDMLNGPPAVMLAGGFWKRKFGASRDVLGKSITLNGVACTIVGVIPADFYFSAPNSHTADIFMPIGADKQGIMRDRRVDPGIRGIGRMKPGVSLSQAKADMDSVAANLAQAYPDADKGIGITLIPLKERMVQRVKAILLVLLAAVGFVLLIACVNVANLLLARSTGRAREFAIRAALGASQGRVVRQLLTESMLLSLAGGGLGLLLAWWGTQAALKVLPEALPRANNVHLDSTVLLFTLGVSLFAGILFGLAPALRTSQPDLHETLKEGGRGSSGARHRTQAIFVAVEMALAVVLLIGAGLTIRSLTLLWSVNPGFESHNVMSFGAGFPPTLAGAPPAEVRATVYQFMNNLEAIPGVTSVSMMDGATPMSSDSELPFWVDGRPKPPNENSMDSALWYLVTPNYLKVMKIPLLRGRFISPQDTEKTPMVCVIDEDFARQIFPHEDPIGKRLDFTLFYKQMEIVGVVGHVLQWGLDSDASSPIKEQFYASAYQTPDELMSYLARGSAYIVRTAPPPTSMTQTIRDAIQKINSQEVVYGFESMDETIADSLASRRFAMILLSVFAALALVLSSIGIYGVISYLSGQRTHEIGVRMALGAQRRDVLRLVLGQAAKMAFAGVGIGLAAALGLTRLMKGMIYGVSASDPVTFVGVAIILLLVALAACYIPARRATRVDPMVALRYE